MSLARKKAARAIRALYGAGRGIRQAYAQSCHDHDTVDGVLQPECGKDARVVVDGEGVCDGHWRRRCAPRRR